MVKLKKTSILVIVFALVLTISFSNSYAQETIKEKQPETHTLKVEVVDAESGEAVPDVKVIIPGKELKEKTGKEGKVTFEKLPAGTHKLKVKAQGYELWENKVEITKDSWEIVKLKAAK